MHVWQCRIDCLCALCSPDAELRAQRGHTSRSKQAKAHKPADEGAPGQGDSCGDGDVPRSAETAHGLALLIHQHVSVMCDCQKSAAAVLSRELDASNRADMASQSVHALTVTGSLSALLPFQTRASVDQCSHILSVLSNIESRRMWQQAAA
jgi:hypothetical protein